MQGKTILVIDDDANLCRSVDLLLRRQGAQVITAFDGREGLKLFFEKRPDLVILDIMMPYMDGYEVCRQIRLLAMTPIIMLTTMKEDDAVVRGLDLGADDFISKPFSAAVLLARLRAAMRRTSLADDEKLPAPYHDDYLVIDPVTRQIKIKGKETRLSAREYDLLLYLYTNAGIVLTYTQILEKIWGWEYQDNIDYVHVYISHLRRKIEPDSRNPRYLLTEHGVGYRFRKAIKPIAN